MAIQFPGENYLEKQKEERWKKFDEELGVRYRERVLRIDWGSWWASLREDVELGRSPECLSAFDNGDLDDVLMKAFKEGKDYVWAYGHIVKPWDIANGYCEDDDLILEE